MPQLDPADLDDIAAKVAVSMGPLLDDEDDLHAAAMRQSDPAAWLASVVSEHVSAAVLGRDQSVGGALEELRKAVALSDPKALDALFGRVLELRTLRIAPPQGCA